MLQDLHLQERKDVKSLIRRIIREFDTMSPAHDARLGHGYGRNGPPTGAGMTVKSAEGFPYDIVEDEPTDEDEMDIMWGDDNRVLDKFISKTDTHYQAVDPYHVRRARVDRRSFAHSSFFESVINKMLDAADLTCDLSEAEQKRINLSADPLTLAVALGLLNRNVLVDPDAADTDDLYDDNIDDEADVDDEADNVFSLEEIKSMLDEASVQYGSRDKTSLVPSIAHAMYKNRGSPVGGGASAGVQTAPNHFIGSKAGWFGAPPPGITDDPGTDVYDWRDIPAYGADAVSSPEDDRARILGDLDDLDNFDDDLDDLNILDDLGADDYLSDLTLILDDDSPR